MSKADRQRRYRRRKRLGITIYSIELDQWHIRQLKDAGLINDDILSDKDMTAEVLGDAIEQLLAAATDGHKIESQFWKDWQGPESMAPPVHREPPEKHLGDFWRPGKAKA